jgi:hypothetical protein
MRSKWYAPFACVFIACSASGYQDYPQALGDLVFRDSDGQMYGRDGIG